MDLRSAHKDTENASEHLSLSLCGDGDMRFPSAGACMYHNFSHHNRKKKASRDTSEEEWDRREDDDDEGVMEEDEEDTRQEEIITGSSTLNSKYVSWSENENAEIIFLQAPILIFKRVPLTISTIFTMLQRMSGQEAGVQLLNPKSYLCVL